MLRICGGVFCFLTGNVGAGELVSLVGEFDPSFVKLFDFTRSSIRSAFDGNVVYQFETMECVSFIDAPFSISHFVMKTLGAHKVYPAEPWFFICCRVLCHSSHKLLNR